MGSCREFRRGTNRAAPSVARNSYLRAARLLLHKLRLEKNSVASSVRANFADLYRSAFAETDPQLKQVLLQQVQGLLDAWFFEQHTQRHVVVTAGESSFRTLSLNTTSRPQT